MSSRGGGTSTRTRTALTSPPPPAALPSADVLDNLKGGPYDAVRDELGYPADADEGAVIRHLDSTLGGNRQYRAMLRAVEQHFDTQRFGFDIHDKNAFENPNEPMSQRALWTVFRAYDSVSPRGEMNPLTAAIQQAAHTEFKLSGTARTATPEERTSASRLYGKVQPGLRVLLRQMYNDTQAWLREHGVTEATFFRGSRYTPGTQPRSLTWNGEVEAQTITSRPLSSWATAPHVANNYSQPWGDQPGQDVTYSLMSAVRVPASRIFSLGHTGFASGNAEVVLLGGKEQAWTRAVRLTGTSRYRHHISYDETIQAFGGKGA